MGYYEWLSWSVPWTLTPIFIDLRSMGVAVSLFFTLKQFCTCHVTHVEWISVIHQLHLAIIIHYSKVITSKSYVAFCVLRFGVYWYIRTPLVLTKEACLQGKIRSAAPLLILPASHARHSNIISRYSTSTAYMSPKHSCILPYSVQREHMDIKAPEN